MQALLVIDMQRFVSDRIARGITYFPTDSIENMKSVIAAFRSAGKPVIHVRHETIEPGSDLHKNSPHYPPVVGFEEQGEETYGLNGRLRRLVLPIFKAGCSGHR